MKKGWIILGIIILIVLVALGIYFFYPSSDFDHNKEMESKFIIIIQEVTEDYSSIQISIEEVSVFNLETKTQGLIKLNCDNKIDAPQAEEIANAIGNRLIEDFPQRYGGSYGENDYSWVDINVCDSSSFGWRLNNGLVNLMM